MFTGKTELPFPCEICGGALVFSFTKIEGTGATARVTCYQCGYNHQDGISEDAAQRLAVRSIRSDPEPEG